MANYKGKSFNKAREMQRRLRQRHRGCLCGRIGEPIKAHRLMVEAERSRKAS